MDMFPHYFPPSVLQPAGAMLGAGVTGLAALLTVSLVSDHRDDVTRIIAFKRMPLLESSVGSDRHSF